MQQKQVLDVLKSRVDLNGLAKDLAALLSKQKVKIIKVKDYPAPRFIDNHDGTVFDTWNNIYIIKLPHTDLPDRFKEAMTWEEAKQACKELIFAGHKDWKLPSPLQAFSLVVNKASGPQIDTSIFKDTKEAYYWTNEEVAWNRSNVRIVSYNYGDVDCYHKGGKFYVRPVRSSQ